ncbi:hypothetical protein SipoB123_22770 [Streptomyces ipomoeae]|uniref:Uncharacterized protein n=1 Tax=Streptomyces ipomoeae 91-03 TaxID=698759 RepID=L1L3F5_9ACTN|nr:hypothetical protein STRIP9103_07306 [Streptomyces ipomoeae 91-03]TQE23040.1 hypothetical protein SipoB123_22770 [Streptomyces ipomoeae]TQE39119.1 hypothetical protein Sipo7851_04785 [Streptomyces ipomoeae]
MADRVGQPVAGRRAQECGASQAAQVDTRSALPAVRWWRRRGGRYGGVRGLRAHGHLRLRGPADGCPRACGGSGFVSFPRPCRCLMLPSPPRPSDRLSPSVKRITHSSEGSGVYDFKPPHCGVFR